MASRETTLWYFLWVVARTVTRRIAAMTLRSRDVYKRQVRARHLSNSTMRNIRENLFFAFVYNVVGVPLLSLIHI